MARPEPVFQGSWRDALPLRWHGLMVPYFKALAGFVVGYGSATALFRPWALGSWWSFGVPLLAGFGVCWWLWQPWALLARNYKGESRRLPLYFTWLLLLGLGYGLRQVLRARLGAVRDLYSVSELAKPSEAVFFRLHGSFYPDKLHLGEYTETDVSRSKNGTKTYYANCFYAYPLLPTATDSATVPAWLGYTYREQLGTDLTPGEAAWRSTNVVACSDARFDTLTLSRFAYLERPESPVAGLVHAVQMSRLATRSASQPLLLTPVQTPFAWRGLPTLKLVLGAALLGSGLILLLLLFMPLGPAAALARQRARRFI